jgi:hypothetical protein
MLRASGPVVAGGPVSRFHAGVQLCHAKLTKIEADTTRDAKGNLFVNVTWNVKEAGPLQDGSVYLSIDEIKAHKLASFALTDSDDSLRFSGAYEEADGIYRCRSPPNSTPVINLVIDISYFEDIALFRWQPAEERTAAGRPPPIEVPDTYGVRVFRHDGDFVMDGQANPLNDYPKLGTLAVFTGGLIPPRTPQRIPVRGVTNDRRPGRAKSSWGYLV